MKKPITSIRDVRPQSRNANRHSPRGMGALEQSIQQDGWIGAITVAADGESFDGSARIETAGATGFDDVEPIVVRSRGDRPIIHVREDIPSATDERAVRLGIAANRVAELNLSWSPEVLAELGETLDLSGLFNPDEMAALLERVPGDEDWAGALGDLPDGDRAPFQQMTFTVSDEQAEQIRRALEKAKDAAPFADTGNENSNGNALARICEVYLGIG